MPNSALRYLLTVETTILLALGSFFFTGYQNFVTKEELAGLFPYPYDKPQIIEHIKESETALARINTTLQELNQSIKQVNYEHLLRINRLEDEMDRLQERHVNNGGPE